MRQLWWKLYRTGISKFHFIKDDGFSLCERWQHHPRAGVVATGEEPDEKFCVECMYRLRKVLMQQRNMPVPIRPVKHRKPKGPIRLPRSIKPLPKFDPPIQVGQLQPQQAGDILSPYSSKAKE